MKKLIFIAALAIAGSIEAVAQTGGQYDPVGYHRLLVEKDIVRAFWSPCDYNRLRAIERDTIAEYQSQGFVLVAKIAMAEPNLPECQYTFVLQKHLK